MQKMKNIDTPNVNVNLQHVFAGLLSKYGTIFGLIFMFIIFSIGAPSTFLTSGNLLNVLSQIAIVAIISVGLTFPLAIGEFDLSVGYTASLSGVLVVGFMANQHLPVVVAILLTLLIGAFIGLINGLLVTKVGVNALITTLGIGTVLVGVQYAYSSGVPISSGLPEIFMNITSGEFLGISYIVYIMLFFVILAWILLNHTEFGQWIQATGGNSEAARLSGIKVDFVKILVFVFSGVAAALGGVLLSSLIGSGQPGAGDGYLLQAFSAVFLGSATLKDGEFHVFGTFIGVLIIGIAFNGLALFGIPTFYQYVFNGGILVLAVSMSSLARKYSS